ncbi:hypothetical protein PILCRDRAFT_826561 [Piloderma croceum F 1598]|uniref:GST N-terminal domain-containing protein n=1 Tax=Piloderma croceum (strain F 1598) TaxID=765440 RepID=A0A0C3AQL2_PILCF|nr:hypothetical protein PILCRDRAFT_826561 [Piloderma croceum F 1598]
MASEKVYHRQCTGPALETVNKRQDNADITLFGSCFCPFVQRVWVIFEYLGVPYKVGFYHEVDPYMKPKELLEISPKGLVPGLRLNSYDPPRALNESTVIMDYLEDLSETTIERSILPPRSNPYARALVRLQSDHINRALVPKFYRYLQAQETSAQIEGGKEFLESIQSLVSLFERAEKENEETAVGLWKEGGKLGWALAIESE